MAKKPLKNKDAFASRVRTRQDVVREHLLLQDKIRYFAKDHAWIVVLVSALLSLVDPVLIWPSLMLLPLLVALSLTVRPQWALEVPFVEDVNPRAAKFFRILGGPKSPLLGAVLWFLSAVKLDGWDPYRKGEGILYLGNEIEAGGLALWAKAQQLVTHIMLMGTTGGGKTQVILGLIQQLVQQGSGAIFVDGKADITTWFFLYTIARMFGREHDLLVKNYLTAGESTAGKRSSKNSNTVNLFSVGASDGLVELMSGMMGEAGANDGMWRSRAEALARGVMRALVELRDAGELILSVDVVRDYMPLSEVEKLLEDPRLSEFARYGIRAYLKELPGWEASQGHDQPGPNGKPNQSAQMARGKAVEQHGYLMMQFTGVLEMLGATYAHIMKTDLGEIDYKDVITNRRILYVMLPSMEKSPENVKNLGRMEVAAIRQALLSVMGGDKLTGSREFIVDARPTNAKKPFGLFLDEYGSYAVEGFGDVVAQARSLGIIGCFAGQDFPSFKKGSEIEAERIDGNTGLKIFLKTENKATAQLLIDRVGKVYAPMASGVSVNQNSVLNPTTMRDRGEAQFQEMDEVALRELAAQGPGEAHVVFGDNLWRVKMFYGDYKQITYAQVNSFLRMRRPTLTEEGAAPEVAAERQRQQFMERIEKLCSPEGLPSYLDMDDEADEVRSYYTPFDELIARLDAYPERADPLMMGPTAIMPMADTSDEPALEVVEEIVEHQVPEEVVESLDQQHKTSVMTGSARAAMERIKVGGLDAWQDGDTAAGQDITQLAGEDDYPEAPVPEPMTRPDMDRQLNDLLKLYERNDNSASKSWRPDKNGNQDSVQPKENCDAADIFETGKIEGIPSREEPPSSEPTATDATQPASSDTTADQDESRDSNSMDRASEDPSMSNAAAAPSTADAEEFVEDLFDEVEDHALGIFAVEEEEEEDEDDE